MTIKVPVFQSGAELSAIFPARKLGPDGASAVDYFAQAREGDTTTLAARVTKGLKLPKPLVYVPLATPSSIARASGASSDAVQIGHLTDDAAELAKLLKSK